MALLVIAILSMLVASIGFESRIETQFTRYSRNRAKATLYAQSGMEVAKMLMKRAGGASGASDLDDDEDRWHDVIERLGKGQSVIGLIEPIPGGYVSLDIEPEPGRLNINLLTRDQWETILGNAGIPDEYFDYIIDPILDWIDADDSPNTHGAETTDYYEQLDPPYCAKNAAFDTVRELLLVKGFPEVLLTGGLFDPEVLRGDTSVKSSDLSFNRFSNTNGLVVAGIEPMLTTYGDGKVNVQSAAYDVLRSLPDVDDILARAIMEEREMLDDNGDPDPFTSVDDLFSRVDGLSSELSSRVTVGSKYYRITTTGICGKVTRQIWAIAYCNGTEIRFLRWCEDP